MRSSHIVRAALVIEGVSMARFKFGLKTFSDVGESNVMGTSHIV